MALLATAVAVARSVALGLDVRAEDDAMRHLDGPPRPLLVTRAGEQPPFGAPWTLVTELYPDDLPPAA